MIQHKDITAYYKEIKESLKDKLFNISKRNNLFSFSPKANHFKMTDVSNELYLNDTLMQSLQNGSLMLNSFFDIVPHVNKLNKIKLSANNFKKTYGYSSLKLSVANLIWENGSEQMVSPMLFIDVVIERKRGQVPMFEISLNHYSLETNPVMQYYFKNELGIDLQDTYELNLDGFNKFIEELNNGINKKTTFKLETNLNPEQPIKHSEDCWTLDTCNMILGEFDYKNMNMVKDYDYYIENDINSDTFMSLFSLKPKKFITEVADLPLSQQFNVFSSDKTQNKAISYSRTGENFIIQGPPGTGKSQTITNMIADFASRGKKVLFVTEKRVALEVVKDKLDKAKLGDFTCLLSDVEKDRKPLLEQMEKNYNSAAHHKYGKVAPHRNTSINQINNLLKTLPKFNFVQENKEALEYIIENPTSDIKTQLDDMINTEDDFHHVTSERINDSIEYTIRMYDELLVQNSELIKDYLYESIRIKLNNGNNDIARKILEHEFAKKRRHKSIRTLIEEGSSSLMFDLVPVWLMNVASVSEALPLDFNSFDVVIFDEASQIKVEQAVPVLYRAKQFITVGDEQQLSPTSFFSKKSSDDEEVHIPYGENELSLDIHSDSLLDQANKNLSSLMLKFHYRSKHKELIEFSNKYFYNSELITVPSKDIQNFDSKNIYDKSITFDYVENGVYKDRKNNKEAVLIAKKIKEIKETSTDTIGVVAFSQAQQKEIEAEILKLQLSDSEFATLMEDDETTFIKNLENVQGDERDIIIASICYGYNEVGDISMNFGPINQQGGDKRLNVVFSRSKKHMIVVSSIKHTDIISDNNGAVSLKNFLEFAENPTRKSHGDEVFANRMVTEVQIILEEIGLDYDCQIGQTFNMDIVVKEGNKHTLGIFIDFFNYDDETSVLNNLLIQHNILNKFGWNTCIINPLDLIYRRNDVYEMIREKSK